MEELIKRVQVWKGPDDWLEVIKLAIVGLCLYLAIKAVMGLWDDWMGYRAMKRKAKLTKEVCEIIEDKFVDGLSEAIASKRLTLDEARILYGKLAHMGFWGLHPRKFTPKKTPEDLQELKERLQAKRKVSCETKNAPVISLANKFLDGIEAELKA